MNFNQNVDREVVDAILESSLWNKANINVTKRETLEESTQNEGEIVDIPEYNGEAANQWEEPTTIEGEPSAGEDLSFTLDDLQVVLDNLEEDALMEHAMNMLEVFDVAYDTIQEGSDPGDEDEEEEEEDDDEEEEEAGEVVSERRKYGGNKGDIPSAMRKKQGHYGRGGKRRSTARQEGEVDYGA